MHRTTSKTEVDHSPESSAAEPEAASASKLNGNAREPAPLPKEIGGQKGPEPTRYGDWEKNGRCTDF